MSSFVAAWVGPTLLGSTLLATVATGAIIGAGVGAVATAINGGSVLDGAVKGAVMGGVGGGIAGVVGAGVNGLGAASGAGSSAGTAADIASSLQVANPALSAADAMTAANAYVSAGYTAADISAVTIGNLGIDTTAATQFANAGYTPAQVQTMLANGATPADFVGMGNGLAGLGTGTTSSSSAMNQIKGLLGGGGGTPAGTPANGQNLLTQLTGLSGSALGAIGSGAASLYGAQLSADAATKAATISAQTASDVLTQQKAQFNTGQANEQPWLTAGKSALTSQQDLMGLGPNGAADQMTALQSDPGYKFRLDQGNRSLNAGLAARGGMGSGKSLTAGIDYNQNFASNEYGNRLTQLASLSNTGQAAGAGMANQGTNYANTVGNVMTASGNNQANAGIASANATQSGLMGAGTALNNYLNPPANQSSLAQALFR